MQDYETNHNSARALNVGRPHLPAGNGVGGRKLNVRRLDIGADFPRSLPEQLENMVHALTAKTLAQLLQVSQVTIYKLAKAHKLPSFRVGTAVRFDPRAVAQWLRQM